ncbi:MAG: hypothetical protein HOV83_40460, partial [Catenulispora sp.]|nr:hypothetical protein [Catenulispora sp.]
LARWRDGRLCGRSLREALPTYAARSRHGLAAGLGFTEEGADRLPVLAWPRADRLTGSPAAPGSEADPSIEPADGGEWPADETAGMTDLWYDSGTPTHPGRMDPWLGAEMGHPFESLDREARNPLYGNGSPDHDDELQSPAVASMSRETQRAGDSDSSFSADASRRESLSQSGVIPLYQGPASNSGARLAAEHETGPAFSPASGSGTGLPVLTWPRTRTDIALPAVGAEPARAVLGALTQASDLVVVDLPRTLDEAATEALALATTALIVVPAEVRASAAASQLAAAVRLITPDLRVVVRLPAPGGLEPLDITDVMGGLPLAGVIGADRRLSAAAEHGEPPGSSARGSVSAFCRAFLDDVFGAPAGRRGMDARAAA